jgi:hypothetical protein
MKTVKQILLQIFATRLGWLVITLVLAVYCGVKAYHTIDEESARWTTRFWWAIAYPVLLVVFQFLFPYLIKIRIRALIVFPLTILVAWAVNGPFNYPTPQWIWYAGFPFLVGCAALIWFQPGTDNLFNKKK